MNIYFIRKKSVTCLVYVKVTQIKHTLSLNFD